MRISVRGALSTLLVLSCLIGKSCAQLDVLHRLVVRKSRRTSGLLVSGLCFLRYSGAPKEGIPRFFVESVFFVLLATSSSSNDGQATF